MKDKTYANLKKIKSVVKLSAVEVEIDKMEQTRRPSYRRQWCRQGGRSQNEN